MTTIRDVAQRAGVSRQTVSNVIHNPARVRQETRQRVQEAVAQLNYHPNSVAQAMRRQSSQALGFFISDPNPRGLADPYYGEVLAGLCEVTRAHGYSLLLEWLRSDRPLRAQEFLRPFHTRQIDAAILFLPGRSNQPHPILAELVQANVPFAVLEQEIAGESAYSLLIANYEGAHEATQALIDAGHQRIAFVDSLQRWPNIDRRWLGYQAAMQENGLDEHIAVFSSPDWTAQGGGMAAEHLLRVESSKRPTALLAGSDMLAVGAMHVLKAQGVRIPDDIALIGFDDFEFSRYVDPPLTTVRLPAQELGQQAGQLLIDHLRGQPPSTRRILLPTSLIVREST